METDVLIVGAGPVGLCLAVALGRRGVACTVLEARDERRAPFPTANHISVRSMEHLRAAGLADAVDAAFPRERGGDWVAVTHIGGTEIARVEDALATRRAGDQSPQREVWAPKPSFDPILERAARAFDCVTLRYGARLESVELRDGGAHGHGRGPDGAAFGVDARFAVGCDGASSRVREALGIGMVGPPPFPVLVQSAFFRSRRVTRQVSPRGVMFHLLGTRDGPTRTPIGAGVLVAVDGRELWRLHGPGLDARDPAVTLARLRELGADDAELLSQTAWTPRQALAEEFRRGPVLLAGDAAHLVTPFGGLGVNTGIGDAFALGWMLEATLDGWGGPKLLDGWAFERSAAARDLLRYQGVEWRDGEPQRVGASLPLVAPADPALWRAGGAARAARAAYAQELIRSRGNEFEKPGVDLGTRCDASPLVCDDGSPVPVRDERVYTPTARPGGRAPHVVRRDGTPLLDAFGAGFTLVRADPDADTAGFERAADARGVPLRSEAVPEAAGAFAAALALVRPDGVVAWRGATCPADPGAVWDRVTGR